MHQHPHAKLYKSRAHLITTSVALVLPFILFLIFSRAISNVANIFFVGTFVSLIRMTIAYIISAILGWAGAVAFYRGRRSEIALPIFDVLQSFPTFAALPLATEFF